MVFTNQSEINVKRKCNDRKYIFLNRIIIFKMDNTHKITYILSRLSIIEETESGNFCDGVKK